MKVREEELPEPGLGEVRVRILATGVSLPDLMMREGVDSEKPRLPFTPGWDLVGVVAKLGVGASTGEPGEMVAPLPIAGGFAELICLPREELVPVPGGLGRASAEPTSPPPVLRGRFIGTSTAWTARPRTVCSGSRFMCSLPWGSS